MILVDLDFGRSEKEKISITSQVFCHLLKEGYGPCSLQEARAKWGVLPFVARTGRAPNRRQSWSDSMSLVGLPQASWWSRHQIRAEKEEKAQ